MNTATTTAGIDGAVFAKLEALFDVEELDERCHGHATIVTQSETAQGPAYIKITTYLYDPRERWHSYVRLSECDGGGTKVEGTTDAFSGRDKNWNFELKRSLGDVLAAIARQPRFASAGPLDVLRALDNVRGPDEWANPDLQPIPLRFA